MTGLADYTIRFRDPAALDAVTQKLDALEIARDRQGDTHCLTDPVGHRPQTRRLGVSAALSA